MYEELRQQSDLYLKDMEQILKMNAEHLVKVNVADDGIDRTEATDMTVHVKGTAIALRVREPSCTFRDFTIRSKVKSGQKTELDKLKEGYGDLYLYGWGDGKGKVKEYVLIDLHQVRQSNLLNRNYKERSNGDGTKFMNIPLLDLKLNGCVLAYDLATATRKTLNKQFQEVM